MKSWKRILSLLLVLAMALGCLPMGAEAKSPEVHEISAAAYARADAIFEVIEALPEGETRAQSIYDALTRTEGVVPGTVAWQGNARIVWETEDGITCAWSARMEQILAEAVPGEEDLPETVVYDYTDGSSNHGVDTYLVQPYYGLDSSFTAQYLTEAKRVAQVTGGTCTYQRKTAATIDFVAEAVANGGVVFFDSHGMTDYEQIVGYYDDGEPIYDCTTGANTSYLCLQSGTGLTTADNAKDPKGFYHAHYMGSSGSGSNRMHIYAVDGTVIANHMTKNANNGLLWAAICLGMATDGLHKPLVEKGLGVAYGYSQSVTFAGDYFYEETFFNSLCGGKTVAQSIQDMKDTWGEWDWSTKIAVGYGYPSYYGYATIEEARADYAAFPIVVSAKDTYPGHGKVDDLQTVYSDWTLLPSANTAPCEHDFQLTGYVAPTCTASGYSGDEICTKCGAYNRVGSTIPALGHIMGIVNAKDPTCTEEGYSGDEGCTRDGCDYILSRGKAIPATGHSPITVGVKEPTCSGEGYTGDVVCAVCEVVITKGAAIPTTEHTPVVVDAREPSCSQAGYTGDTVCRVCNALIAKGQPIPTTEHTPVVVDAREPSCSHEGYTGDTVCRVCNALIAKGEVIPTTEHTPTLVDAKEPTCSQTGYTGDSVCAVCNLLLTKGQTIPTLAHTPELRDAAEPSCVIAGYSGDLFCSVCNTLLEKGHALDAPGHSFGEWVVIQEPTEVEPGLKESTCTVCGFVGQEAMDPKTCLAADFPDVNTRSWYHEALDYVLEKGIMVGQANGTFDPNGTMTRAQLATIFWNLANKPNPKGASPFTDVKITSWYGPAVVWAAEQGIVSGITATTFSPNTAITRQQVATMLYRYAGSPEPGESTLDTFPDSGKVATYAVNAMVWAVNNNIIRGNGSLLDPRGNMTRAQAAQLFMNYLG